MDLRGCHVRMLDTIKFNGVDYEVKRKLTFGEVRQFQKTVGSLLGMDEKIKTATDEELEKIAEKIRAFLTVGGIRAN